MDGAQKVSGSPKGRIKQCMKIVMVAVMIALVCGEIALYVQIRLPSEGTGNDVVNKVNNQESCYPESYIDVCKDSLQMYQQCLGEGCNSSEIHVPLAKDQVKIAEEQVLSAINSVEMVNLSQTCMETFSMFTCFYYFGLCDSNAQLNLSLSEQCEITRNESCTRPWLLSNTTGSIMCSGETLNSIINNLTTVNIICSKGFYLDESIGICLPECGKWKLYPDNWEMALDITLIISGAIGCTAGILGLTISCKHYKQIFQLPNVLVVYQTVSVLLHLAILLIGRTDPTALFCSSKDMGESFSNPTPFCIVSAVMDTYTSSQIAIWWFLYVAITFWGVFSPFHYRSFQAAGKTKRLHKLAILAGILLPLVSLVIIICTGNFMVNSRIPPLACSTDNDNVRFYSHILPIIILYTTGTPLFIFIFLQVCKKHLLKESKLTTMAATAKVVIIISYFAGIITYVLISLAINRHQFPIDSYAQSLREYFLCESAGVRPGKMCDRSKIDQAVPYLLLYDIIHILVAWMPVVMLIYVVNYRELQLKLSCRKSRHSKQQTSTKSA